MSNAQTAPRTIEKGAEDGATWVEAKAIIDISKGTTRSYFWSKDHEKRYWDKPPRNAAKVIYWDDVVSIVRFDKAEKKERKKSGSEIGKKTPKQAATRMSLPAKLEKEPQRRKQDSLRSSDPSPRTNAPPQRLANHRDRTIPKTRPLPPQNATSTNKSTRSVNTSCSTSSPPKSKEMIGSVLVMAAQGNCNMRQIVGAIEQKENIKEDSDPRKALVPQKGSLSLLDALPPPDGDEYDYKVEDSDQYQAKPSATVKAGGGKIKQKIMGDGDLWVEAKVLLDAETKATRSYFYSKNTHKRVWDEPPSGAGKVIYLKDVKRVYLREKGRQWHKDGVKNKNYAGKTHQNTAERGPKPGRTSVQSKPERKDRTQVKVPTRLTRATAA